MTTEEIKTALKDTFQALKSLQAAEVSNPVESDSAESAQVLDPKKKKTNVSSHWTFLNSRPPNGGQYIC